MTTENITAERLDALKALLLAAVDTIDDLADQVEYAEIDHVDAAAIVNETIQNLTIEAR